MTNTTTRNDVKQLAEKIESLAREVQEKLNNNDNYLPAANELVRNNLTFVFAIGGVYALEQVGSDNKVKATSVGNYHNVRDNRGRFTKRV